MGEHSSLARGLRHLMTGASDALVSVLFPDRCRICESLLTGSSRVPICDQCLLSFRPVPETACPIRGWPLHVPFARTSAEPGQDYQASPSCTVCARRALGFDRARSFGAYPGALVRAIMMLKFERMEPLGAWFVERLVELVRREEESGADVVVPGPLHRNRERERGYHQVDLIARPLAKRLKLPYRAVLLVRPRPRPEKQLLSLEERWESVRGAFATRRGTRVDNLRVLLVDDVMTTGATLDACARVLRQAGAKLVIGLTVARALQHAVAGFEE